MIAKDDAADAEQPGFALEDELLDEGQAEGRHGAEHGVAQRRADAGHVARHRAHGDRPADAERRRRADRHGDQEADGGALDGERDRIEDEARDVHCVAIAFPP